MNLDLLSFFVGFAAFPIGAIVLVIVGHIVDRCIQQCKTNWQKEAEYFKMLLDSERERVHSLLKDRNSPKE